VDRVACEADDVFATAPMYVCSCVWMDHGHGPSSRRMLPARVEDHGVDVMCASGVSDERWRGVHGDDSPEMTRGDAGGMRGRRAEASERGRGQTVCPMDGGIDGDVAPDVLCPASERAAVRGGIPRLSRRCRGRAPRSGVCEPCVCVFCRAARLGAGGLPADSRARAYAIVGRRRHDRHFGGRLEKPERHVTAVCGVKTCDAAVP